MRLERLRTADDPRYAGAMALYQSSFPYHEQREKDPQAHVMGHEQYHFDLIYQADAFVGLILYWEAQDFFYIEHFCTAPEVRGRGYGAQALEMLNAKGKTVILEIDPPVDELAMRRKGFYERAGFNANPFQHCHPPYHAEYEGHPLMVMSFPAPLTQETYESFASYLHDTVMQY